MGCQGGNFGLWGPEGFFSHSPYQRIIRKSRLSAKERSEAMKKKLRKTILASGPMHPLQEEMEFFQLSVDGETVTDIDVRLRIFKNQARI